MELAVPCDTCKPLTTCDCKQLLVSYFRILDQVHKRVLSTKVTSSSPNPPIMSAGIDKLDARFSKLTDVGGVLNEAHSVGFETKIVYLKSRKPYLYISNLERQVHLSLDLTRKHVTGLVSNPNKFESWTDFMQFLEAILPNDVIQSAILQRLDLNVDFTVPFSNLIEQIDIKNKSVAISYDEKGGQRTGLNIGKKPELIVIYDKAKKNNESAPHSRLELRLSGPKLPPGSIYNLPQHLRNQNYFKSVLGKNMRINGEAFSGPQNLRLQEFKSILKRDGLYSARKFMNKTRNFDRDFAKILSLVDWSTQPNDLFKQGIELFLGRASRDLKLVQ